MLIKIPKSIEIDRLIIKLIQQCKVSKQLLDIRVWQATFVKKNKCWKTNTTCFQGLL